MYIYLPYIFQINNNFFASYFSFGTIVDMERDKLWNSLQIPRNELSNECFFNPTNWDNNSTDFALTSIVSSPATSNLGIPATNNIVVRELIGRLGSICNSGEISPHSFIAANNNSTPPPQLNLTTHLGGNQLPSGFAERAAKFSSFGGGQFNGSQMGIQEKDKKLGMYSRSPSPEKGDFGDSMEESSVSEQIPGGEIGFKGQTEVNVNPKKRKAIPRGKAPSSAKAVAENEESDSKRSKGDEGNAAVGNHKQTKDNSKTSEPPKDYIHVRARRGQATDSHSLAERVRREKISERMKFLQDLVPGCNKVTGKAVMLDEIINYVQSLQQQVEFLSMKLSTVNPRMDFNMEDILSKDIFQSGGSLPLNIYPVDASAQTFPYTIQSHQGSNLQSNMPSGIKGPLFMNSLTAAIRRNSGMPQPSVHGYSAGVASQISSFWDDDLQNVVHMGFGQNRHENFHDSDATNHMKVEL